MTNEQSQKITKKMLKKSYLEVVFQNLSKDNDNPLEISQATILQNTGEYSISITFCQVLGKKYSQIMTLMI